jgi:hypothetical protein
VRFGRTGIATLVATVATTALWADDAPAGVQWPPPIRPPAPPLPGLARRDGALPGIPRRDPEPASYSRRTARRAEELIGRFGLLWWRNLRAQAVSSLDRAATATFGPLNRSRAAVLGRDSWFEDADVDVFVVGPADEASFVAVPVGTTVTEDGEVFVPPPDASAYTVPLFAGPWGTSTTSFFTALNTDDGGLECGPTTARTVLRATWRKLEDRSGTRDYWGVDLAALAEVATTSNCNDFVDSARIGFRSSAAVQVVGEEPASGRTQHCSSRTLSVGASWGGVSGSVSQAFTHCERIGVSGAFQPASVTRTVMFDNNGNCHAGDTPYDGRELAQVGVVEVPQGAGHGLVLSFGVDAGNASTCKEDRC